MRYAFIYYRCFEICSIEYFQKNLVACYLVHSIKPPPPKKIFFIMSQSWISIMIYDVNLDMWLNCLVTDDLLYFLPEYYFIIGSLQ